MSDEYHRHYMDDPEWDVAEDGYELPDPQQWIARIGLVMVVLYVIYRLWTA